MCQVSNFKADGINQATFSSSGTRAKRAKRATRARSARFVAPNLHIRHAKYAHHTTEKNHITQATKLHITQA